MRITYGLWFQGPLSERFWAQAFWDSEVRAQVCRGSGLQGLAPRDSVS